MRIKPIVAVTLLTGFFLSFQNCSQVQLEVVPEYSVLSAASLNVKASYCPDSRALPAEPAKYIFVIDMSASNVGDWETVDSGGSKFWYWDATVATDPEGNRFKAVEKFLSTCGNQSGSQFAIVGFSTSAGIITGTGASRSLNCTNVKFGSAADALTDLNGLKQAQTEEAPWFMQWKKSTGKYLTDPTPRQF